MTKQVVLSNFDDLVEVFPSMTLSQIISVYKQVQTSINNITTLLKTCVNPLRRMELENDLNDCLKADAFLGTYLARYCCKMNGF